ncbi:MAG: serine/threonine protein kinase [Planctomycetes bacterium]|nr:serine/threonine protein kinase [Planctomycetota bacterium]
MAVPKAICPVCGESTSAGGGPQGGFACPRCKSTFGPSEATVVDSNAASSAYARAAAAATETPGFGAGPGQRLPEIPGYEVLDFVARGGMGLVLKARHLVLDRLAAIKMPLPGALAEPSYRERFLREARAAAHLRHPNICPIYEVSDSPERLFIAMAFIEGQTLRDWAKAKAPSPRQAAEMVAALARGVGYAHEHGVVHRDIKPANVMVDKETGEPVLTDFGLAKELRQQGSELTGLGMMVGTPAYMAPEQAMGQPALIGPHTDVYALGGVLYELLCGRPPYLGTLSEILYRLQNEDPVPLRKLNHRVHRDLETICLKALAKEPGARYASAVALAEDLERFSAGEPIRARRMGVVGAVVRKARRNPVAAAFALALLVAAAVTGYVLVHAGASRRLAALRLEFDTRLEKCDWTTEGLTGLESLAGDLGRLSPEQGASARERLYQRFAEQVLASLRRPTVQEGDVKRAEADIRFLEARAPEQVAALRRALEERLRAWQPVFDLRAPFAEVGQVFEPGRVKVEGDAMVLQRTAPPDAVPRTDSFVACEGNVQAEVTFARGWEKSALLGARLNGERGNRGYFFLVSVPRPSAVEVADVEAEPSVASLGAARSAGAMAELQIARSGSLLRATRVPAWRLGSGPLRLRAGREGNRLSFQAGDLEPVVFEDMFPISGADCGVFGLCGAAGMRVERFSASRQALPAAPSPLERGDELYARGQIGEALAFYREQAIAAGEPRFRQEARYKEALCLDAQKRLDEAGELFSRLAAEGTGQWPMLAACQLWLLRLRQDRLSEAHAVLEGLSTRYRFEELALLLPDDFRGRVLSHYRRKGEGLGLMKHDPDRIRSLERVVAVSRLLSPRGEAEPGACRPLVRAYLAAGETERAKALLEKTLRSEFTAEMRELLADYSWLLRLAGENDRALEAVNRRLVSGSGGIHRAHCALLVERARIRVAMGQWAEAEADVEEYLKATSADAVDSFAYQAYSGARLIQGFLRERRGDAAGALDAWRSGYLRPESRQGARATFLEFADTGVRLWHFLILGSLSEETTDADLDRLLALWVERAPRDSAVSLLAGIRPPSVYAALREMWRSARGRDLARRIAFRELSYPEFIRLPVALCFNHVLRADALGGTPSEEQDALAWGVAQDFVGLYCEGRLSVAQVAQAFLTWKGTTNFLGWAGLAPSLEPKSRGPLAYLLGRRYLRLGKPKEAADFFRTALADAAPDSPLRRLAQAELDRLKTK